jgi:hypothetical protein
MVHQFFQKIAKHCHPKHDGTFYGNNGNQTLDHLSLRMVRIKRLTQSRRPAEPWPVLSSPFYLSFTKNAYRTPLFGEDLINKPNNRSSVSCMLGKGSERNPYIGAQIVNHASVSRSTAQK